jgi:general secretion pathway protein I
MARPRPVRGFTIIEVLVALAVLVMSAIMLGAAYLNVLNSYAAMTRAGARNDDVKFAAEAILAEPDRDTVEKGGDFDNADGNRVQWKATIDPTETADVFSVTFECTISSSQAQPDVTHQTFLLLRPTWSKSGEGDKLRATARDRILKIQQALAP